MTDEEIILLTEDPEASAEMAGLRYVSDEEPGISRKRWGRGFTYISPDGEHISDSSLKERFESLAIPPAWTDVWICADEQGHIQVTGRDDRGRKQYIYHPQWDEVRNQTKFNRMVLFGEALPELRQQVDKDLRRHGTPRERVVAAVVQLLQDTLIRVGNPEYARENQSYGLTTMRMKHVEANSTSLRFEFKGKSSKVHQVDVRDARLARVVRQIQELPGYELFQYVDETGQRQKVESGDVNDYVREVTKRNFTAKDFRTWGGTVAAVRAIRELGPASDEKEAEKNLVQICKEVAEQLGNTATVCRQYYMHPAVLSAYSDGTFFEHCLDENELPDNDLLSYDERLTLCLLRRSLAQT